jgi:hypothetical protein
MIPEFIRDSVPETLGLALRWSKIYKAAAPYFMTFLIWTKAERIIDLCSGSGELVSIISRLNVPPGYLATASKKRVRFLFWSR